MEGQGKPDDDDPMEEDSDDFTEERAQKLYEDYLNQRDEDRVLELRNEVEANAINSRLRQRELDISRSFDSWRDYERTVAQMEYHEQLVRERRLDVDGNEMDFRTYNACYYEEFQTNQEDDNDDYIFPTCFYGQDTLHDRCPNSGEHSCDKCAADFCSSHGYRVRTYKFCIGCRTTVLKRRAAWKTYKQNNGLL